MHIIWLVVIDLFAFMRAAVEGIFSSPQKKTVLILPTNAPKTLLTSPETPVPEDETAETEFAFKSIRDILPERPSEMLADTASPSVIRHAMIVGRHDEPLFVRHVREYDGVLTRVPYGASVSAGAVINQWVDVTYKDYQGYINRDALYEHVNQTRPYFVIKEFCAAVSENTKRLRHIIHDEFSGALLELPLQAEEYVAYRLFVTGVVPPTTHARPRTAGSWQRLYRGLPGVKIGVRPKTGAVMEYLDATGVGHLAYVEAVFPDESISLSEVGDPEQGFYNEVLLTHEEWMARQPVFLQF